MMKNTDELEAMRRVRLHRRINLAVQDISKEDLHTLQHDVLSRPSENWLPAILKEPFFSWLADSYGPVDRETRMAPENQRDTELRFLEESIESDDVELAMLSQMFLNDGKLGPRPVPQPGPSQS